MQTKAALRATLDSCFGGQVAEEIIYGTDEVSTGCSSDLEVSGKFPPPTLAAFYVLFLNFLMLQFNTFSMSFRKQLQ